MSMIGQSSGSVKDGRGVSLHIAAPGEADGRAAAIGRGDDFRFGDAAETVRAWINE